MQPSPLTIANSIIEDIRSRIVNQPTYISRGDFWLRQKAREIEKLKSVDTINYWILRACLNYFQGNVADMEQCLDQASNICSDTTVELVRLQLRANVCLASRSQDLFREFVDIKFQNLKHNILVSKTIGAFQGAMRKFSQAELAHVNIDDESFVTQMKHAAQLLEKLGVTDPDCAGVIDCAGHILRERKLFWMNSAPDLSVYEETHGVALRFKLNTSYAQATEMNGELADLLISKNLDQLPFYVTFEGSFQ